MSLKRLESGSLLLLALGKQNLEVFLLVGKHLQKSKGEAFSNFKLLLKLLADQGSSFGAGLTLIQTNSLLDKLVKGKVQETTDLLQATRRLCLAPSPLSTDQLKVWRGLLDDSAPV